MTKHKTKEEIINSKGRNILTTASYDAWTEFKNTKLYSRILTKKRNTYHRNKELECVFLSTIWKLVGITMASYGLRQEDS